MGDDDGISETLHSDPALCVALATKRPRTTDRFWSIADWHRDLRKREAH